MKSPALVFTPSSRMAWAEPGAGIITLECFTTSVKFAGAIKRNLHVFITRMRPPAQQPESCPNPARPCSTGSCAVNVWQHRGHQIDSSLES